MEPLNSEGLLMKKEAVVQMMPVGQSLHKPKHYRGRLHYTTACSSELQELALCTTNNRKSITAGSHVWERFRLEHVEQDAPIDMVYF